MADVKQGTPTGRRGGPPGPRRPDRFGGKEQRSVVQSIREATGASVEDIQYQLRECGGDVNKATEKLIDTPFTVVQSKKPKTKPMGRGRGRGRENGAGRGRPYEGNGRGRGHGAPRGRGNSRNKVGGKVKPAAEAPSANGKETEQTKTAPPPAPMRKAYLDALCGKGKAIPHVEEDIIESGFLMQKQDYASFAASGWEAASSPPDTPVAAFRGGEIPEEMASEEEKSVHVDSVADVKSSHVKEETKSWADEVEDALARDAAIAEDPKPHVFPFTMHDIRFTREDTTPLKPSPMPMPLKLDSTFGTLPNLESSPLDMSSIEYLFGTFEGLTTACHAEPTVQPDLPGMPDIAPAETAPAETSTAFTPEPEPVERQESTSQRVEEVEVDTRRPLHRPSAELLPSSVDASEPRTGTSSDFRLDAGSQVLDIEVPQPPAEQTSFISSTTVPPAVKEEPSTSVHSHLTTDAPRDKPTFVGTLTSQGNPAQSLPSLEDESRFVKPYAPESFGMTTEKAKKEELTTFEETRPHRPPTNLPVSKPVMETDSSFGISSGPAPTLPSYQPQRHPQHKLHDKPVPSVGTGVTGHQPNPKYNAHPGGGVPPPGQNQNPSVHVPASLNPTNSGNSSLPMMPQVPFLNPGMIPNPGMPFPTGAPYYPQFMQYQHQMYHGLYAGTYGSFGAPFNHESVGHPAHPTPVGVPPNQGNQQFPVSFPNTLYTLGNNVYDTANPSTFSNNKEKDNVFLNQQQLSHTGFPGGPQPVPRNDGGVYYGVPGQAFSQGFRNQFPQPPGFNQFHGAGFVAPPHTFHPSGQQGNNFRLR